MALTVCATLVATYFGNLLAMSLPPVMTACEPTVKSTCPILATGAKPIIEVTWRRSRAPLALYPLGFSKQGRFAWLEQRQGFDSQDYVWILQVVDLNNDRVLAGFFGEARQRPGDVYPVRCCLRTCP